MPADGSTAFTTVLSRCHRRLRLVAFVRHGSITGAIALAIIDVVLLTVRHEGHVGNVAVAVSVASILLAVAAAYTLAVVSVPSVSATARIVDRECGLHDRATTALQFLTASDLVSRLIVADAVYHVERIPPSRFRFAMPAVGRWLGAVAVVAFILALTPLARSTSRVPPLSNSSPTTSPGRAAEDVNRPTRRGAEPAVAAETGRMAGDPGNRAHPAEVRSDVQGQPVGKVEGRLVDDANKPTRESGDTAGSRATSSRPSGLPAGRSNPSSAETGSSSGSQGSGDTARGSGSALSASGRGANGAVAEDSRHGGVGRSELTSGPSRAAEPPAIATRHTAAYAAAYGRAESATRRETVPANLRSYVRAYFLAIRPGQ
jgi:hypothetical protein